MHGSRICLERSLHLTQTSYDVSMLEFVYAVVCCGWLLYAATCGAYGQRGLHCVVLQMSLMLTSGWFCELQFVTDLGRWHMLKGVMDYPRCRSCRPALIVAGDLICTFRNHTQVEVSCHLSAVPIPCCSAVVACLHWQAESEQMLWCTAQIQYCFDHANSACSAIYIAPTTGSWK